METDAFNNLMKDKNSSGSTVDDVTTPQQD